MGGIHSRARPTQEISGSGLSRGNSDHPLPTAISLRMLNSHRVPCCPEFQQRQGLGGRIRRRPRCDPGPIPGRCRKARRIGKLGGRTNCRTRSQPKNVSCEEWGRVERCVWWLVSFSRFLRVLVKLHFRIVPRSPLKFLYRLGKHSLLGPLLLSCCLSPSGRSLFRSVSVDANGWV
jgi:hypothetical protein